MVKDGFPSYVAMGVGAFPWMSQPLLYIVFIQETKVM